MGSSVRQDPNTYLLDLIQNLQARVKELEESALTSGDIVAESLQLGEPNTTPSGIGDASLANDLVVEGYVNIGSPSTPATAAGDAVISGDLDVEGTITGSGVVTGGDSHDHIGGDGAAIDTNALADDAVTTAKIDAGAVDTTELANDAVDDTKAGNRVPQLIRRKGGSSSNWSTAGSSNYTPTAVRIQCGSVSIPDGGASVTFPVSFSNAPIAAITPSAVSNLGTVAISAISSSSLSISNTFGYSHNVMWIAIGPE